MRRSCLVATLLMVAACTSADTESAFRPSLEPAACPDDVAVSFLSRHECSYLTVLENRDDPRGATVRLLVVKVWPVGVEPAPGVATGFGGNIGDPSPLGGAIAAGATRSGHVTVQMEPRGAGRHATPSLRCPEVDELSARGAASRTGDPGLARAFVAAVRSCRDRLTADGVDVAAYGVAPSAGDVEDLRVALGLESWAQVGSEGTRSLVLFHYLQAHPDRVDLAVADSPTFPHVDEMTGGRTGTAAALDALFTRCAQDSACARDHPTLEQDWEEALRRSGSAPLRRPGGAAGTEVLVDAGKLLRLVRSGLGGDGPSALAHLPRIITAAARGVLDLELARLAASDPLFCAGYRPVCSGQEGFAWGAYLTVFCGDRLPLIDQTGLRDAAGGSALAAAFVDDPYLLACKAWDVGPMATPDAQPLDTSVPLLLLSGQFDSWSPSAWSRDVADRLESAWAVEVPGHTHNVLGSSECALTLRNAWRRAPTAAPVATDCLADQG